MTDTLALELTRTSADDLHARTVVVARKEQQTTLELLVHLHEIERRKVYAGLGYGSLWEYSMKALGYSEAQTAERVSAMRLMFRDEEARKALEEGTLNVTQAAMTERHLRAEEKETKAPVSPEILRTLLSEVAGRSKRETERVLLSYRPREERPEKIQSVTQELSEIRFSIPEETRTLIERFWELHGRGSLSELFTRCLSFYLEEKDPLKKTPKKRGKGFRDRLSPGSFSPPNSGQVIQSRETEGGGKHSRASKHPGNAFPPPSELQTLPVKVNGAVRTDQESQTLPVKPKGEGEKRERKAEMGEERSRYVTVEVKRQVWKRSQGTCEFIEPSTEQRCRSRYRLELDHIHPFALGGTSDIENIRLICRTHNQYWGDEFFSKNSEMLRMPLTG